MIVDMYKKSGGCVYESYCFQCDFYKDYRDLETDDVYKICSKNPEKEKWSGENVACRYFMDPYAASVFRRKVIM